MTGRQCCLRYMVQYLSVHLDTEVQGKLDLPATTLCGSSAQECRQLDGNHGSGKTERQELRKTVGVQECLRDRQRSCFGRAEEGTWTARPGLQGLESRREHPHAVQPFASLLPTSVGFSPSSQNSYLLEQASCQDVTIEMFALDSVAQFCWVNQHPPNKWQKT